MAGCEKGFVKILWCGPTNETIGYVGSRQFNATTENVLNILQQFTHLGVFQLPPRVGQVIPHAVVVLAQPAVLLLRLLPELKANKSDSKLACKINHIEGYKEEEGLPA